MFRRLQDKAAGFAFSFGSSFPTRSRQYTKSELPARRCHERPRALTR